MSGTATAAQQVKDTMEALEGGLTRMKANLSDDQVDMILQLLAFGVATYAALLDHLHKRAVAGRTPDLMSLSGDARQFIGAARHLMSPPGS
jgi:hypothetical protein